MVIIIVWSTLLLQGSSVHDRQRELREQNEQEMKEKSVQKAELRQKLKDINDEGFKNDKVLDLLRDLLSSQADEAKALAQLAARV
jgi:hypothetical protein